MGRPRKRRREDAPNDSAVALLDMDDSVIAAHGLSIFGDFGSITPPQLVDSNGFVPNDVYTNGTTLHHHPGTSGVFEVPPDSNLECVASRNRC